MSGLLAIACSFLFARSVRATLRNDLWHPYLLLTFFLWFIPFLSIRCSSENWSGLMLLLALTLCIRHRNTLRTAVLVGVLLGLAFQFRYQSLICSVGLVAWMIMQQKATWRYLLSFGSAFAAVTLCAITLDSWFYGEPVLAPLNYFRVQLIEGVASEYGVKPWYWYLYLIFRHAFFPIGTVILLASAWFLFKERRGPIAWATIPFILAHTFLAHKELRFLFPVMSLVPYMLVRSFQALPMMDSSRSVRLAFRSVLLVLVLINVIALTVISLKPADVGRMRVTHFLHDGGIGSASIITCAPGSNPLDPWGGSIARYYNLPNIELRTLHDLSELDGFRSPIGTGPYLLVKQEHLSDAHVQQYIETHRLRPHISSMPDHLLPWLQLYGGFPLKEILVLYGPA